MTITLKGAIPILRMYDIEKTRDFYLSFLGFTLDWEHRFGENFPLYMQISRSGTILHLSEHHGDGTPGTHVFVTMTGVDELHRELTAKNYRFMKPGIEDAPWGARTVTVVDPVNNRITFSEYNTPQ
jgi:catechol 2,3-dioxygenase-like lactoylglutathione lyase family enzyme